VFPEQRNEIISTHFMAGPLWIDYVFVFFISEFRAKANMYKNQRLV
jgi:hypothetical protein